MTEEDVALFRQAEQHAKSGRQLEAYNLFRILRERNPDRVEILFWIVETTPHAGESEQSLLTIKRLVPNHPHIPRTEKAHQRRFGRAIIYAPPPPVLRCPYCGMQAPALAKSRIAVGGWIWFSAFFLLFLGCMFALVPTNQMSGMGTAGFFFLIAGIVGLFAIRKRVYACGHCGSQISSMS